MVAVGPGENKIHRLARQPLPMQVGPQYPAGLKRTLKRGLDLAAQIHDAGFADEATGVTILDNPEAEAEQGPHAAKPQDTCPAFAASERSSANVTHDIVVGP